jgi:hypothetical protein
MGLSGQRHAPAALYPRGKNPRYPLDRRLGGPQNNRKIGINNEQINGYIEFNMLMKIQI